MEDLKICQKPTKHGQVMFCKAVKVDMANSKDTSFNDTITSSFSLINVLYEDLFEAINIHKEFFLLKKDPQPSISLLNATNTFPGYVGGYIFERGIINNDEVNALQKDCVCCLMVFVSLDSGNSTKIRFVFWWK
jgi:hypothetical protein